MNNSRLTFGHITSLFVVIGAVLGAFGIYDKIVSKNTKNKRKVKVPKHKDLKKI